MKTNRISRSRFIRHLAWVQALALLLTCCLGAALASMGLFISSLTDNQTIAAVVTLLGVAIFRYVRQGRLRLLGLYLMVIGAAFILVEFLQHITFGTRMFDWSLYCTVAFGALGLFLFVATLIPPLHAHLRKIFYF